MRTPLCDLLSIDYPIIQAGMGPFTAADLVVAVSSAGGLGSLGSSQRSPDQLRDEMLPALMAGRFHEYVPFAGETVGLIRDILPVADIIRRLVDEATAALRQATALEA